MGVEKIMKAVYIEAHGDVGVLQYGDRPDPASAGDLSLTLLRHHPSSVKHHQYHNADVLIVRVDRS